MAKNQIDITSKTQFFNLQMAGYTIYFNEKNSRCIGKEVPKEGYELDFDKWTYWTARELVDMPDNIFNFMKWVATHTGSIQSNVRSRKGKMYFLDRRTETGRINDGGLDDLWTTYVKEMIG